MENALIIFGLVILAIGILIIVLGALSEANTNKTKWGAVGFIGPIPIGFGSDSQSLLFTFAIAVIMIILTISLRIFI